MNKAITKFKYWDRALSKAEVENECFITEVFSQCEDSIASFLDTGIVRIPSCFAGCTQFYNDTKTGNNSITGWIKDNFDKYRHVAFTLLSKGGTLEYLDGELYYE